MNMKKQHKKLIKLDDRFVQRFLIATLVYAMFMVVVWGVIAQVFPNGIQPPWLFWFVIGLSIAIYFGFIIIIEYLNYKRSR